MFNVFLPKMLEMRSSTGEGSSDAVTDGEPRSLERTMWDVVIFTIGGCPGAIVSYPFRIPDVFGVNRTNFRLIVYPTDTHTTLQHRLLSFFFFSFLTPEC